MGQKHRLELAERGITLYRPVTDLQLPEKEESDDMSAATTDGKPEARKPRREARGDTNAIPGEGLMNEKNLEEKLDEVRNREDHRSKEGRALKTSA